MRLAGFMRVSAILAAAVFGVSAANAVTFNGDFTVSGFNPSDLGITPTTGLISLDTSNSGQFNVPTNLFNVAILQTKASNVNDTLNVNFVFTSPATSSGGITGSAVGTVTRHEDTTHSYVDILWNSTNPLTLSFALDGGVTDTLTVDLTSLHIVCDLSGHNCATYQTNEVCTQYSSGDDHECKKHTKVTTLVSDKSGEIFATYDFTLGTGTSGVTGVSSTPLPGALPLFISGLGGFGGLVGWRRRRKLAAAAKS